MARLELLGGNSPARHVPLGAVCGCLFVLGGCGGDGTAPSAGAPGGLVATVEKAPIELIDTAFVRCAGDEGELVELQVREQVVTHESIDTQGKIHFHFIVNDKGTTGVGLSSGTRYRQTGATTESYFVIGDSPVVVSVGNALNLIAQGTAPNLTIHETFHLTINRRGVATVERETQRIECR